MLPIAWICRLRWRASTLPLCRLLCLLRSCCCRLLLGVSIVRIVTLDTVDAVQYLAACSMPASQWGSFDIGGVTCCPPCWYVPVNGCWGTCVLLAERKCQRIGIHAHGFLANGRLSAASTHAEQAQRIALPSLQRETREGVDPGGAASAMALSRYLLQ